MSIAVFQVTKDLGDSAGLNKNDFWVHSTAVGSGAKFLSSKLKLDREESFTAGIVHDMGKIIMDSLYSDFYREVLARVESSEVSISEAERDVVGLTHSEVGAELAQAWNLPPELLAAVAHHHRPTLSDADSQIACLVHVGDHLARKFGMGSGGDNLVPEPLAPALGRLNLTVDQLDEWEDEMKESMTRDQALLSILKG